MKRMWKSFLAANNWYSCSYVLCNTYMYKEVIKRIINRRCWVYGCVFSTILMRIGVSPFPNKRRRKITKYRESCGFSGGGNLKKLSQFSDHERNNKKKIIIIEKEERKFYGCFESVNPAIKSFFFSLLFILSLFYFFFG